MNKLIISFIILTTISCTTSTKEQETNIVTKDSISMTKDSLPARINNVKGNVGIIDSVLIDERDQQQYKIKRFENLWWMVENLNYDIGDSLLYRDTYIGMAGYCLDNNPENCKKYGRLYDLPAAIKACPKGWRIPTSEEWRFLNKKHANCVWDKASMTGNYRDSLPEYNPIPGGDAQYQYTEELYFYPRSNTARYWTINNKSSSVLIFQIEMEKCYATLIGTGGSTRKLLAQKKFYSCRCVQEVN